MKIFDRINKYWDSFFEEESDDYDAILEDHEVGEKKYYRLYYLNYHNIGGGYLGRSESQCGGEIDCQYKPFCLPTGMSKEDAFKVLSYLTDFIEKHPAVEVASWKSVSTLDSVLDLERFGFKRLDFVPNSDDVMDLFIVTGRIARFKKRELYNRYFNWYKEGVKKEEVEVIYAKIGLEFKDIVFRDTEKSNEAKTGDVYSSIMNDNKDNKDNLEKGPVLAKKK